MLKSNFVKRNTDSGKSNEYIINKINNTLKKFFLYIKNKKTLEKINGIIIAELGFVNKDIKVNRKT